MTGRTKVQDALMTNDAAWRWYTLGYEGGTAYGYARGWERGFDSGQRFSATAYDDAARMLAETLSPLSAHWALEAKQRRERILAPVEPTETLEERHARVAASWGLTPQPPGVAA